MSTHFRHCPKHRKPLPCAHCALAVKPAPIPVSKPVETASQEIRSTAEIVQDVVNAADRGKVGIALAFAEKRKPGRPPKYKSDEDRKKAEVERSRGNRKKATVEQKVKEFTLTDKERFQADQRGRFPGEDSGGQSNMELEEIVEKQNTDNLAGTSENVDHEHLSTPDRKVTQVPVSPDKNIETATENDDTFMRKASAQLNAWAKKGGPKQKRTKLCEDTHAAKAEREKDSRLKVYCGCGKMLVNPGKPVKHISELIDGKIVVIGISRTAPEAA